MTDFGRQLPDAHGPALGNQNEWAERLRRVESRNITFVDEPPLFWTEASGCNVRDTNGRVYLDLTGAFGVALAGHAHPVITERIVDQSRRLIHGMGDIHPPMVKVEFLEALAAKLPWDEPRIILGSNGSDAVEAALKTARLATGRTGIVAFEGSYHGLALGALAATDRDHFREPFIDRLTDHVSFVPFPTRPEDVDHSLAVLDRVLGQRGPIGAVLVEPIQGRAGVRIPPPGFLSAVAERARAAGALFVADEIFTGMGRTGRLFALNHEGLVPDLLCLGKALGGGMPIAACCGPVSVMEAWPESTGEAIHTSTFLGHPLACAAGLGFLQLLDEENLVARAHALGGRLTDGLAEALAGQPGVEQVEGRGLMIGVTFGTDEGRSNVGAGANASTRALEKGIITLPAGAQGHVLELTPAALLTDEQLEWSVATLAGVIANQG